MDLDPTIAHLSTLFADFGVEWCVAGAIAANAYRPPRDTTDLDLVVQIHAPQYTRRSPRRWGEPAGGPLACLRKATIRTWCAWLTIATVKTPRL